MKYMLLHLDCFARRLSRADIPFYTLAWLMVLVVSGTVAQKYIGLYLAQKLFFYAAILWVGPVPLPGGLSTIGLLLISLTSQIIYGSKWTLRRAGINIAHLGAWLLIASSIVILWWSHEGNMVIAEGQTVNQIADYHDRVWSVTDVATSENILTIPWTDLRMGKTYDVPGTPLRLNLIKYCRNCAFVENKAIGKARAEYQGRARNIDIISAPLKTDDEANQSGIQFRITGSHQDGIYFSVDFLDAAPTVTAQGKTYRIALQKRRTVLPFSIELVKFTKDTHPGTEMARAYQSDVIIHDGGASWPSAIEMNSPLRYRGYTFYQSSFIDGDVPSTVLAVVDNPGRWLPYIASTLMAIGLFLHLFTRLNVFRKHVIGVIFVLALWSPTAQASGTFDDTYFRTIPVLDQGRVKPLDSFANTMLYKISGETNWHGRAAYVWLAGLIFTPDQLDDTPIIRVREKAVRSALGLATRPGARYSYEELSTALRTHTQAWEPLLKFNPDTLTHDQRQLLNVIEQIITYGDLQATLAPHGTERHPAHLMKIIPVMGGKDWLTPYDVAESGQGSPDTSRLTTQWQRLKTAYQNGETTSWKNLSRTLRDNAWMVAGNSAPPSPLQLEVVYNILSPLAVSMYLYLVAFGFVMATIVLPHRFLTRLSVALLSLGLIAHLGEIILRMMIMGRPPVTNLYASVLFVGFIVVITGLIYAIRTHARAALVITAITGIFLQLIAKKFKLEGDQLGVLSAVLDTNFWLATHVVMITIGYATALLTGLLAHGHLWGRWSSIHTISFNHVRVMGAIALFTTATGTILGGIWADQSWGRFWGWDPKENGALLIVLWILFIMHGRHAGKLGEIMAAALYAATPIIVAIAWFGVNLLGVGLHSYGFTQGATLGLTAFIIAEIMIITGLVLRGKIRPCA